jgi:hypothetical protein
MLISWDWQGEGHTWEKPADNGTLPGRYGFPLVIGIRFPLRGAFCQTAFPRIEKMGVAKISARLMTHAIRDG